MHLSSGKISRKMSTLHKMVDAAAMGEDGVKWNHVLHYLKTHCIAKGTSDDDNAIEGSSDESNSHTTRNRSNISRQKRVRARKVGHDVQLEENPLPEYYVASEELKQEFWVDSSTGDSVLRSCLSCAPPKIVAAMCFLFPEALKAPDTQNRLALHYACRYPVSERLDAVMKVLITAFPASLVCRDDDGRTPLHYLFWHHACDRSPTIVSLFCKSLSSEKSRFYKLRQPIIQKLPKQGLFPTTNKENRRQQQQLHREKQNMLPLPDVPKPSQDNKIPYSAAVIPDSAHGCLPLHYAVMENASIAAIEVLYQAYPQSKHCVDRYGRTPLHWYLGAGTLDYWNHEDFCSPQHVSGEEIPLDLLKQAIPSYNRFVSHTVVKMLLSSRVARTADFQKRYPLHWAVCFLAQNFFLSTKPGWAMSLQVVQLLLDHFVGQVICCDYKSMTPAMLLFDTVARIKLRDWLTSPKIPDFDLTTGGSKDIFFSPPMDLLEMLLKHPDPTANANVAAIEDYAGRLPVHVALEVASSPECISLLIKQHPTALIHTAEETLFVPLHSAFCNEYTAPLQTAEIVNLLLQSIQAGRHGTLVDGRLAMKMEDAAGFYAIHYAAQNGACLEVINMLVERYPNTALQATPNGDLPVHCLINEDLLLDVLRLDGRTSASLGNNAKLYPTNKSKLEKNLDRLNVTRSKINTMLRPLLSDASKLAVADHRFGMLPLHCGVLFEAADYRLLLRMLQLFPQSAEMFTKEHMLGAGITFGPSSPLDLHEQRKPSMTQAEHDSITNWLRKRELLFSFNPRLESHRHRQELLDQCVRVVIEELGEISLVRCREDPLYRYHLCMNQQVNDEIQELEISHSVSNMEKEVLQSFGLKQCRPPRREQKQSSLSKRPSENTSDSNRKGTADMQSSIAKPEKKQKKRKERNSRLKANSSIYDDEGTSLGYDTVTDWDDAADGDESESMDSGVDTDEPYSSDESDNEDDEFSDRGSEEDMISGDASRSFGYTTSGSRLRTTFEDGSGASDEDEETRTDADDDDSRSFTGTEDTGTRQTFDDDESTILSRQATIDSEVKNAFDAMKESLEAEEKKEDYSFAGDIKTMLTTPRACNNSRNFPSQPNTNVISFQQPDYMSEVALRIWAFFVLYCDANNPSDNYVKQVSDIIDEIKFSTVDKLVSISMPSYGYLYLADEYRKGLTFRDVASPKCRELIHKTCYFVGRYDLRLEQLKQQENCTSVLVHRSTDGSSVTIRALEWLFTTEEVTAARDTGIAVENIWATGEIPSEIGVTFRSKKRPVWITFTKDFNVYQNEIGIRTEMDISVDEEIDSDQAKKNNLNSGIVPLLNHFNALSTSRKKDRTYNVDINDERFNTLNLFGGDNIPERFKLCLSDYPFALVFTVSSLGGTLDDYFWHFGLNSYCLKNVNTIDENRKICCDVAAALAKMHENAVVHGDISMSNLIRYSGMDFSSWSFLRLSNAAIGSRESQFTGGITVQGYPNFKTGTLPPEMFVKLSPSELKSYNSYWAAVREHFQLEIEESLVDPMIDLKTGNAYVVKCHFIPWTINNANANENPTTIPPLPYELVPTSKSLDFWALGQLVFLVCASRTLLPVEGKRCRLLDYSLACSLDPEPLINEYVHDALAQDVLLLLLSPQLIREKLHIDTIMSHPFFVGESASSATLVKQIVERRRVDRAAHKREQRIKFHKVFEHEWLEKRTVCASIWDFEILEKIHLSPSQIIRGMNIQNELVLPSSFLLLPFKMPSEQALSTIDSRLAENTGKQLLLLSKACYFTSVMKQATSQQDEVGPHRWSSSEMLRVLDLSSDEFSDVQAEMADLAALHVESFRKDPMSVALKLVQKRVQNFFACFDDKPLYLYLVDEFYCQPILGDIFPLHIPDDRRVLMLEHGLLSMHLCSLYARGAARGISGMAKLFFNDSNYAVPPSWTYVARGLNHKLDEVAFIKEMNLLEDALTDLFSTKHRIVHDDVNVIHDYLSEVDPHQNLVGIHRVVIGDAWVWTGRVGATYLQEIAKTRTFSDALRRNRRTDAKLKEYKHRTEK